MQHKAKFTFHGSLNDFLRRHKRGTQLVYTYTGKPAVKDAIEAMGIPHPEVACIVKNGYSVSFQDTLLAADEVDVYPMELLESLDYKCTLIPPIPQPVKFILDVHLGTLAKALRMLGFDTLYEQNYADAVIAKIANEQQRVVLTRDICLLKQRIITYGYWLRSQETTEQIKEVLKRYNLTDRFSPFERCLLCNERIHQVSKDSVLDRLPPKTKLYFNEFFRCSSCDKVYWKGSHYEHMQEVIKQLRK